MVINKIVGERIRMRCVGFVFISCFRGSGEGSGG